MPTWKEAWREGVVSGSIASLLSAAWLVRAGSRRGEPAAPVNAVSHWFFGDLALHKDDPSVLFTLSGYLVHHGASIFWGVLYAKAWGARRRAKRPLPAAAGAAVAAATACLVDYRFTPKRFTPGFEHRLERPDMATVYATFALGLMIGSLLMRRR